MQTIAFGRRFGPVLDLDQFGDADKGGYNRCVRRARRADPPRDDHITTLIGDHTATGGFMNDQDIKPRRRVFLKAATATAGGAALGFPMIAKSQGPISMRWQSTWPTKDIFHEYAQDFAK